MHRGPGMIATRAVLAGEQILLEVVLCWVALGAIILQFRVYCDRVVLL